jgi:hypothetical protein
MSQIEKLLKRLQKRPKDFTWQELCSLLNRLGYLELKAGKTGGSRRKFVHANGSMISLHKPHPSNVVKRYMIDQIVEILKKEGHL